jgi:MFS family permease
MTLDLKTSRHNFRAYLWHAVFLALTTNFIDMDTVLPSMIIKAGGGPIHIGLITAILLGGTSFFQLFFSGFLSKSPEKKKYLLSGIHLRILSLISLGILLFNYDRINSTAIFIIIILVILVFAVSGAFANVSYVDILGKSMLQDSRKRFFSLKQLISGIGILLSAFIVREILRFLDFPVNYAILFIGAGILLLIGSAGFWKIHEIPPASVRKKNIGSLFKSIPGELRRNPNLRYYIILINGLGLGISLLPFLIVFARDRIGLTDLQVGNYLLFRVTGMVLLGFILFKISTRFIYKQVMIASILFGSIIPVLSLLLIRFPQFFQYIFILNGFFFTSYKVAQDGILVEISDENNRVFIATECIIV